MAILQPTPTTNPINNGPEIVIQARSLILLQQLSGYVAKHSLTNATVGCEEIRLGELARADQRHALPLLLRR
jgi:hypothetical protein